VRSARYGVAIMVLALALARAGEARAGGGSFGNDEDTTGQDSGPAFFGFVKDNDGDSLDDVKITVTVKNLNSSLILRTDSQGHYFVRGFDKSVNPDDVAIACTKDGYHEAHHVRKPALDPGAPVEVDCILEKQAP
jgi:hypothetical protein